MAKWNKKRCGRILPSTILNFLFMYQEKLYDFKWTAQREIYDSASKSKGTPFFRTSKKCCFLKVVKRRVTKEPLNSEFLDEIHFTITLYKWFIKNSNFSFIKLLLIQKILNLKMMIWRCTCFWHHRQSQQQSENWQISLFQNQLGPYLKYQPMKLENYSAHVTMMSKS